MGYGFARARGARLEQLGFSGSGSVTTVTSAATAGTFGTTVSIGATGFAYDGLLVTLGSGSARRGIVTFMANTGGADQIIADSIPFCAMPTANFLAAPAGLPIRLPAGAAVSAKAATQTTGNVQIRVSVTGYRSGALARGFSRIVSLTDLTGCDPANLITLSGTTLTGWVTVQASTPADIGYLWAMPQCVSTTLGLGSGGQFYVEIGWGGSGSERPLFKVPMVAQSTFFAVPMGVPCMIPAGTRIAARAQANNVSTATVGVICYGAQP